MAKATVQGLRSLRRPEEVALARGLTVAQVLPIPKAKKESEQAAVAESPAEEPPAEETAAPAEGDDAEA
jgi:hypothetical protein